MLEPIISSFLFLYILFGSCPFENANCPDCKDYKYKVEEIGRLPEQIRESSGLILINDLFLSHGDSGNKPLLYGVKYPFDSNIVHGIIDIKGQKNVDWEDLAFDGHQTIYIGDFGNNRNDRKDLNIIKYNIGSQNIESMHFSYLDQDLFPPAKSKNKNYDCEAMFWFDNELILFSKNKKSKYTKIYRCLDNLLSQQLAPYDSIKLKNTFVTAADISPDKSEAALLAYGKVLLFDIEKNINGDLLFNPKSCIRIRKTGQAEAITYLDNENLVITNEKGKVFLIYRKFRKSIKPRLENPELVIPGIHQDK